VTLSARDVEQITRLLEESSFDELHLEMDGLKLHIRRQGASALASPAVSAPVAAAAVASPLPPAAPPPTAGDPREQDVVAPLLGTFYRAPKPGAPAFVEVGAAVDEDTVIGIIEVMKLMNAVRAGVRGIVTAVLAQDGALVEHGERLLRVRRA
jgi:acetyl-CoA carboxylase biotin carboxyl carrier protein